LFLFFTIFNLTLMCSRLSIFFFSKQNEETTAKESIWKINIYNFLQVQKHAKYYGWLTTRISWGVEKKKGRETVRNGCKINIETRVRKFVMHSETWEGNKLIACVLDLLFCWQQNAKHHHQHQRLAEQVRKSAFILFLNATNMCVYWKVIYNHYKVQ
jgi:hypothetical protein